MKFGLPILAAAAVAVGLAALSHFAGEARVDVADGAALAGSLLDAGLDAGAPAAIADAGTADASWRYDRRGRLMRAPADDDYLCRQPRVEIARAEPCASGIGYPACRWQLPVPLAAEEGHEEWEIWRNTTDDHRWARPGLVSLLVTVAAEYRRRWPGEHVTIGDLDAPGPRHQTHDRGVDVDVYLEEAMIARNEGGRRYPDNYEGRSRREVRALRARVMDLAKIIATCADGQIRIYYNDPDLIRPFRAWFEEQGMHSDVGRPMRMHNELHRFHFHLTVPEEIEPLELR